jgi:hypothetical protein
MLLNLTVSLVVTLDDSTSLIQKMCIGYDEKPVPSISPSQLISRGSTVELSSHLVPGFSSDHLLDFVKYYFLNGTQICQAKELLLFSPPRMIIQYRVLQRPSGCVDI